MPSSRLRVYQYLPYLESRGIQTKVIPAIPEPWFSRYYYSSSRWDRVFQYSQEFLGSLWRLLLSSRYDLVFIQKGILSTSIRGFDSLFQKFNSRLIFDLDDAIYGRSIVEFQKPFLKCFQDPEQTQKLSSKCRAVIAGNNYLRGLALQYNKNVFLIPTPVDTNRFCPKENPPKKSDKKIVIGWIGTPDGIHYVRLLEKVFQELAAKYLIQIKLVTRKEGTSCSIPGVPLEIVSWTYKDEVRQMQEFDIVVMPLPAIEWVKGKCGLKLLQYMAVGIPTVSARVGVSCEMVQQGVDGFLASETKEWVNHLSHLIEDADLRQKMGEAARKKAVDQYSLEKTAPLLAKILKETCY